MTPKRRLPTDGESAGSGNSAASTAAESVAPTGQIASPRITVLPHRHIPSPEAADFAERDADAEPATLAEALAADWPTDAHFTAYEPFCPPELGGVAVRLASGCFAEGVRARMVALVGDVDDPDAHREKRPTTTEWRALMLPKLKASGLAFYETSGGFRVLGRLGESVELCSPADARAWQATYRGWIAEVERAHGLKLDPACSDWTRLYRLPNVERAGLGPVRAKVIGELPAIDARTIPAAPVAATVAPSATGGAEDRELTDREIAELDRAAELIEPSYHPTGDGGAGRNNLALAIGGWLKSVGLPPSAAVRVVSQLPSEEPERRVKDALRAWAKDGPVEGWAALRRLLPGSTLTELQALAVGPSARKGVLERLAARNAQRTADPATADESATPIERWPNTFTVLDLENEPPPVEWLIPDLEIGPGRTNMTAGFGNDGKTTISQQRNFDIALGRKLFGHFDVRRGDVLHLDYDGAGAIMLENYARLCRGHGIDRRELAQHLHVARPNKPLTDPDSYDWLCWLAEGYAYCSIDALVAACPGLDENAVKEIVVPLYLLERVSNATGVTFDVVHHETKPPNGTPAEARYALRGSSGIYGALSSGTTVRRAGGEDPNVREVSCLKRPRFGFEPFGVRFVDVPDPATAGKRYGAAMQAGRASWGLRIEHAELSTTAPNPGAGKADAAADRIEDVLRRNPLGWKVSEAKTTAGLDGPTWGLGIARCIERGSLGTAPGGKNSTLLTFLPEASRTATGDRRKLLAAFQRGGIAAVRKAQGK